MKGYTSLCSNTSPAARLNQRATMFKGRARPSRTNPSSDATLGVRFMLAKHLLFMYSSYGRRVKGK